MADNENIVKLVRGVEGLVTLSHVFVRINQLIDDPDSSMADVAKAVSQDPSFTVRLLRVANSSFYGLSSSIDTVDKAVSVIGTGRIRSLALSMSVASSFAGLPNDLVAMDNFWRHSLYCAVIARILARKTGKCDPEAVFTAGLLHDIGELVIFNRLPEQAKEALLRVLDSVDDLPIFEAERQVLGFDHAQVGAELVRQWNLPPLLMECIGHHHSIGEALDYPHEVALVHIANIFAQMAEIDTLDPEDVSAIDLRAWVMFGMGADLDIIEDVVREAQEEIVELEKLFIDNAPEKSAAN
ncbi:MAG: HDOD domain-containing protein [Gallionella sp.]|jgi:putative nucleotidyltransferase with HDIG domain|nr:HDOD domain-containing protein [Gallionella sp.]MCK9353207.1 HDOD domain-containing protein [Gallionella sp.]